MAIPIIATKLYAPRLRPRLATRPRLIERLNTGLHGKLTLVSAPAGFGKTSLVGEWVAVCGYPCAWLSLDEGDKDCPRFLSYLAAALGTVMPIGTELSGLLQSPHTQPGEFIQTALLNEIAAFGKDFVIVLDDFHLAEAKSVDDVLAFLLDYMPPHMHMVIATREDPKLGLARLRARGQLTELRQTDLRFTLPEVAGFLNHVMGLQLTGEDIAALDSRTEGWIAGLQLAALSMRNHPDTAGFIRSFTGSHHFVLDYLMEEVLQRQPENVQTFLLRTSILDRMCGPLCDAVLSESSGQETLTLLENANLFIVPLDSDRRWYRYHHLFADLLRQRLQQIGSTAEYHIRACDWYEENGQELDALRHAVAAGDTARATRIVAGKGMPLYFRGAMTPVRQWLESLSPGLLDADPSLWIMFAWSTMISGQPSRVEAKLRNAEAALRGAGQNEGTRDLMGQMATLRSLLTASQNRPELSRDLSLSALELLSPGNLAVRTAATCMLGIAHLRQGDRNAAARAFNEVISTGLASGNLMFIAAASASLGVIQETGNQLKDAADTYRRAMQLIADPTHSAGCEVNMGLARIYYEWNDLDAALQYVQLSSESALNMECDTMIASDILLGRIRLARQDAAGAALALARAGESARRHAFTDRAPEIAAARVLVFLSQGKAGAAAELARAHDIPASLARVHLFRGEVSAALAILESLRQKAEERGHADTLLKVLILQALAHYAGGEKDRAVLTLREALALALPGAFVRSFVDEGKPMAALLSEVAAQGVMHDYASTLLAAFEEEQRQAEPKIQTGQPPVDPLSRRELEVLELIDRGLSNHEICERLFLSLSTVKWHNQKIFDKLRVQRRTEAIARARELSLLPR